MHNQEMIEKFRNHGIMIDRDNTDREAFEAIKVLSPDELTPVVEDFMMGGITVEFANQTVRKFTLGYALLDAYKNGKDRIEQSDMNEAFTKATRLSDMLASQGSTRPDQVYSVNDDSDEGTVTRVKKSRDAGLQPLVFSLVEDNPKAQGTEIVEMVHQTKPNANEGTIKVYYSKARKELGLPNIGKRGRSPKTG